MSELLPPNATPLERNLASVCAEIARVAVPLRDLVNPDTCPEQLLPWLAAEMGVAPWSDKWTAAQKRAVIANSYQVHRQRGTLAALKSALFALGIDAEVVEWWQETPPAAPYTFRVDVETFDGMDTAYLDAMNSQIDAVKPVRSRYSVRLIARPSTIVHVATGCSTLITTTIYPKSA